MSGTLFGSMRAAATAFDIAFQDIGLWMWFVHMAMSGVFAGLLFAMWVRLQRAFVGWMCVLLGAHAVVGAGVSTYWWGGLTSPVAVVVLAIVTGGAISSVTPLAGSAARALRGEHTDSTRVLWWTLAGMVYAGIAAVAIMQTARRTDLVVALAYRPLALVAAFGPIVLFKRVNTASVSHFAAARILYLGFVGFGVLSVAETVFRSMMMVSGGSALPVTATVVSNLLALLTIGIAALLATIAHGRVELQAALEHEVRLSRQEAQEARLESLGRLAAGIANDFNGLFRDANRHLNAAREQWQTRPAEALVELQGVRFAVERGTEITTGLLRLARHQETAPRRISPAARMRELLPVLTRMMSHAQDLRAGITARNELFMAPVQFDQLVLNVLLAAMEAGQSGSVVQLVLRDVASAELARDDWSREPFDVFRATHWVQLTVICEVDPQVVRTSGESELPVTRSGAWRRAGRELGAVLGQATAQLATEAAGGHVRIVPSVDASAAIEVWLPAQAPAATVSTGAFAGAPPGAHALEMLS